MMSERRHVLSLIQHARASGARLAPACDLVGLSVRTVQRWMRPPDQEDGRRGPKTAPKNKLSVEERQALLACMNSEAFRNLSPKQIVPKLADQGVYLASESTMYRVLREHGQLTHRDPSRPRQHQRPPSLMATGPNQVYSWDITYLKSPINGLFFYLYLFVDIWSRKIVGAIVEEQESAERAAELAVEICAREGLVPGQVRLHSDNGGPMKGATMLATLQQLGIVPSFSRPSVSNDNPYSEALFRTLKYRPEYPRQAFASLPAARDWVERFVSWYNTEHLHSGIGYVTPTSRHTGADLVQLKQRREVYRHARTAHPHRWSSTSRGWCPGGDVVLNDRGSSTTERKCTAT